MGTGVGLEGEVIQPREGTERLLQEDYQRPGAHHRMLRLQGVQVLELWQGSHLLVDLRIVLHRTGAEGIEARINTEVIIREVRVVAHHRQFVALWQRGILGTAQLLWNLVIAKVISWQTISSAAFL